MGDAGLKGEATYFHPYEDFRDKKGRLSASVTLDHMFPHSIYMAGSYLWNSEGFNEPPRAPRNVFRGRV
ncbi:MAG: hypothetical protein ABEH38_05425, partial [Flavobacteriales bacterium]